MPIPDQLYTGEFIEPELTVMLGRNVLTEDEYWAEFDDNYRVGTASVEIGIGGVSNFATPTVVTFEIVRPDISEPSVATITVSDVVYEEYGAQPSISVVYNGDTLTWGYDYDVEFENNTQVGTATAIISGINDYTGTIRVDFQVLAGDLTQADVSTVESMVYTGEEVEPGVQVLLDGWPLDEGTDYVLDFSNNVNVGTATVTVRGIGGYAGEVVRTFEITSRDLSYYCSIESIYDMGYTGDAHEPEPAVWDWDTGAQLVAGRDYTVSYENNVGPGEGSVTVTGTGNYVGELTQPFTILGRLFKEVTLGTTTGLTYNGKAHTPSVTVVDEYDETLVEGEDYEVSYANNVNAGTATITVRGKGVYGAASYTHDFVIAKAKQAISCASAKTVAMGKTVSLGARRTAGDGKLTYRSSNTKVATVSSAGVVTPRGVGKATVTVTAAATANYAAATRKVTVTVTKGAQAISASGKTVMTGKTVSLGAGLTAGNGKLTYRSSNAAVATVSAKGVVTGKNVGTMKITITAAGTASWNRATRTVSVRVTAQAGAWKGSGSRWWYQWTNGNYPKSQFLTISGKTYYFDASGYCVYGWKQIGGKYYYFESSGAMAKGKWVGNYWLGADGAMATSAWVDGGRYWVGADGAWVKGKAR